MISTFWCIQWYYIDARSIKIIRSQFFKISSTDVKIKAKRKGRPGYNVINSVSFKYHNRGHRGSLHWSQMVELPSTPT